VTYDDDKQFCQMVDAGTSKVLDLCGGKSYIVTEFCQKGEDTDAVVELCGGEPYLKTEFCQEETDAVVKLCGTNTFSKTEQCCGSTPYPSATHFCQSANVPKPFCGGEEYDADHGCVTVERFMCQGANSSLSTNCQKGFIVDGRCGSNWYIEDTHRCINDVVVCGMNDYNSATHFCDERDGQIYKKVIINGRTWMAENMNYYEGEETIRGEISRCFDNEPANCNNGYGRMYTGTLARMVCPENWHLPSQEEWLSLIGYVNGGITTGTMPGSSFLKASGVWPEFINPVYPEYSSCFEGRPCEDPYGFAALPAGVVLSVNGSFSARGTATRFWGSGSSTIALTYVHVYNNDNSSTGTLNANNYQIWSVRCIHD
jgi:uncharacterized protein (TIGR02145 family)